MIHLYHSSYTYTIKGSLHRHGCLTLSNCDNITVPKSWNQPRGPSTNEWTKKMGCFYPVECYSAIMKNKILLCTGKWVERKFTLSEKGQIWKDKYHMFCLRCGILKIKAWAGCHWFMPAILATQEAEIRRISVQSQLRQTVRETLSQKYHSQEKGW
jgi:hypothetical protein